MEQPVFKEADRAAIEQRSPDFELGDRAAEGGRLARALGRQKLPERAGADEPEHGAMGNAHAPGLARGSAGEEDAGRIAGADRKSAGEVRRAFEQGVKVQPQRRRFPAPG